MKRPSSYFVKHHNGANEVIDADHMNQAQEAIQQLETEFSASLSSDFKRDCLFTFGNCKTGNTIQLLDSDNFFLVNVLPDTLTQTADGRGVALSYPTHGVLTTQPIKGHFPQSRLNHFTLIANADVPVGSQLLFTLRPNNAEEVTLKAEDVFSFNATPTSFQAMATEFVLSVTFISNFANESPILYGVAIVCEDELLNETFMKEV